METWVRPRWCKHQHRMLIYSVLMMKKRRRNLKGQVLNPFKVSLKGQVLNLIMVSLKGHVLNPFMTSLKDD